MGSLQDWGCDKGALTGPFPWVVHARGCRMPQGWGSQATRGRHQQTLMQLAVDGMQQGHVLSPLEGQLLSGVVVHDFRDAGEDAAGLAERVLVVLGLGHDDVDAALSGPGRPAGISVAASPPAPACPAAVSTPVCSRPALIVSAPGAALPQEGNATGAPDNVPGRGTRRTPPSAPAPHQDTRVPPQIGGCHPSGFGCFLPIRALM